MLEEDLCFLERREGLYGRYDGGSEFVGNGGHVGSGLALAPVKGMRNRLKLLGAEPVGTRPMATRWLPLSDNDHSWQEDIIVHQSSRLPHKRSVVVGESLPAALV